MSLGPQGIENVRRTWQAILQEKYGHLGTIEVSVVEDERASDPSAITTGGQIDRLPVHDEPDPSIQGRRAA